MERQKPRSKKYIFFRNCLIIFLHVEKKMMIGNISDEVKLGVPNIKLVLAKYAEDKQGG